MTDSPEHIAIRLDFLRAHIASALKMAEDLAAGMGIAQATALHGARCFGAEVDAAQKVIALSDKGLYRGGVLPADMKGRTVRITDDEMVIGPKGSAGLRARIGRLTGDVESAGRMGAVMDACAVTVGTVNAQRAEDSPPAPDGLPSMDDWPDTARGPFRVARRGDGRDEP